MKTGVIIYFDSQGRNGSQEFNLEHHDLESSILHALENLQPGEFIHAYVRDDTDLPRDEVRTDLFDTYFVDAESAAKLQK